MYALSLKMRAEPCRTLAFGSISGAYTGIGTALVNPARQIFVQNLTDATLMFSLDGIHDAFPLPEDGFFLSDITSNETKSEGWYMAAGDRLYVKTLGTPTTGNVYFSVFYGANN